MGEPMVNYYVCAQRTAPAHTFVHMYTVDALLQKCFFVVDVVNVVFLEMTI